MRIYDPRIGKFLSVDPLSKDYPWNSTYAFAENDVMRSVDLDGMEKIVINDVNYFKRTATIKITKQVIVFTDNMSPWVLMMYDNIFSNIFKQGDVTLYAKNIPRSNASINFTDNTTYDKGTGFALNVKYDVHIKFDKLANEKLYDKLDPEYSEVYSSTNPAYKNIKFSNPAATWATSGTEFGQDRVVINDNFSMYAPLGYGVEAMLAHEVGFHNMMRLSHQPVTDGSGNKSAYYPETRTLEM